MEHALFHFSPNISSDIFIKDPATSGLGKAIIHDSIELIDEIGLEEFNFKKLASKSCTTEATVYRYFENKHKLLLYITSWYWSWVEYQLVIHNTNISSDQVRLSNAIKIIGNPTEHIEQTDFNIQKLFNIICQESSKVYLVKEVDALNKNGVYYNYKKIVATISDIILRINPEYPYPHTLVTTIIEGIHHQIFFSKHLPSLTESSHDDLTLFYNDLAFIAINHKP
ncbi:MAG: TetR/AcrR family transcriptional regulator [Saprospiraceae bacterium]|nr:TetR/AcrR family transcriptional regulator [Saprospiraceae bacterium]